MSVYTNATQNPDPVFAFSGFRTALGKPFCVSQGLGNIANVSNCVLLPGEQIHTELLQITNSIAEEEYSRIF